MPDDGHDTAEKLREMTEELSKQIVNIREHLEEIGDERVESFSIRSHIETAQASLDNMSTTATSINILACKELTGLQDLATEQDEQIRDMGNVQAPHILAIILHELSGRMMADDDTTTLYWIRDAISRIARFDDDATRDERLWDASDLMRVVGQETR